MSDAIYAIVGICLAVLITFGLSRIQPHSGDAIIQPEGEPDPGKRN